MLYKRDAAMFSLRAMEDEALAQLHGHPVGEKCDACVAAVEPYVPLGGALTFSDLRDFRSAQKTEGAYSIATYDFQALSQNILTNKELEADEKADRIVALSEEFRRVVGDIYAFYPDYKELDLAAAQKAGRRMSASKRGVLQSVADNIKKLVSWSDYEDDEDDEDKPKTKELAEGEVDVSFLEGDEASGFKVYDTEDGPRWLAFSSNSFEDREKEIFTAACLEEAVAYAEKSGDRGPLRAFHVEGADIGDCDFQTVIGRFLVESGTFRDDELGRAGLKYLREASDAGEKFQISIGYRYRRGDDLDGIYDWIRFKERSVLPYGRAANPYTAFALNDIGGDKEMDQSHEEFLIKMFGPKVAKGVISKAQEATKELEGTVRYKEAIEAAVPDPFTLKLKALADELPAEDARRASIEAILPKVDEAVTTPAVVDPAPAAAKEMTPAAPIDPLKVALTVEDIAPLAATVIEMGTLMAGVKSTLEEIKASLPYGSKEQVPAPRAAGVFAGRPTDSNDNVLTGIDAEKLAQGFKSGDDQPKNPALPYVQDWFGGNGNRQ